MADEGATHSGERVLWWAILRSPPRFLRSGWPWRSLLYLASGLPVGVACLLALGLLGPTGVLLTPVGGGVLLLVLLSVAGVPLGALERRRLRLVDDRPVESPHRTIDGQGGRRWLAVRLREPATWRELGYLALFGVLLWPLEAALVMFVSCLVGLSLLAPVWVRVLPPATVPAGARLSGWVWLTPLLGVLFALLAGYLLGLVAAGHAVLVRALVARSRADPVARLVELTRSRSRLVSGFDNELRRIERDLHDGAQRRLLGVGMTLALARAELAEAGTGSDRGTALVVQAHEESQRALAELREVVRGVHPRILTDRGLAAALADLTTGSRAPIELDVRLPGRYPPELEAAVYHMVAEALTNADRHSGADRVALTARQQGRLLWVEVRDNGRGGADPGGGSGLRGMADRADTIGARLTLVSPSGGPTVLRLEVTCDGPNQTG